MSSRTHISARVRELLAGATEPDATLRRARRAAVDAGDAQLAAECLLQLMTLQDAEGRKRLLRIYAKERASGMALHILMGDGAGKSYEEQPRCHAVELGPQRPRTRATLAEELWIAQVFGVEEPSREQARGYLEAIRAHSVAAGNAQRAASAIELLLMDAGLNEGQELALCMERVRRAAPR